ncbi:MAG: flippase-like domain-containing protein [Spartobacteria bacterium]|nr:flippase-like domain-containing protein [Spartobacteria bacterium]
MAQIQTTHKAVRRMVLFLIVSIAAIAAAIYFTWSPHTVDAIKKVSPVFIPILLVTWLANVTFDALSLKCLAAGTSSPISFLVAYQTSVLRVFFNIITPFNIGGQPFMVYFLSQKGMPAGKASSMVFTKLMSLAVFTLTGAFTAYFFLGSELKANELLNVGIRIAAMICALFVTLLIIMLVYPHPMIVMGLKVRSSFRKMYPKKRKMPRMSFKIVHVINEARHSFRWYFGKHRYWFLFGMLYSFLMYCTDLLLIFFSVRGLGLPISFQEGIVLCSVFELLLAFLPTPGAAGLGEFVFVILFSQVVPSYMIGLPLVVWRFFYNYLSAVLGAFVAAGQYAGVIESSMDAVTTGTPEEQ